MLTNLGCLFGGLVGLVWLIRSPRRRGQGLRSLAECNRGMDRHVRRGWHGWPQTSSACWCFVLSGGAATPRVSASPASRRPHGRFSPGPSSAGWRRAAGGAPRLWSPPGWSSGSAPWRSACCCGKPVRRAWQRVSWWWHRWSPRCCCSVGERVSGWPCGADDTQRRRHLGSRHRRRNDRDIPRGGQGCGQQQRADRRPVRRAFGSRGRGGVRHSGGREPAVWAWRRRSRGNRVRRRSHAHLDHVSAGGRSGIAWRAGGDDSDAGNSPRYVTATRV